MEKVDGYNGKKFENSRRWYNTSKDNEHVRISFEKHVRTLISR